MAIDERQSATPDVDLIVATVNRDHELSRFLASVRDQESVTARVIVVDQNQDDRVAAILDREADSFDVFRLRATMGVSHARNSGYALATAPLVAWPDDDCVYPPRLLRYVLAAFAADPGLDVLVGRAEDPSGRVGPLIVPSHDLVLDSRSVWRYPNTNTFFARRRAADRVGDWNTGFGPGGTTRWDAGEDSDWLIRAVHAGLCVRFDPAATVLHRDPFVAGSREAGQRARRYGRCTAAVALANGYGVRFVTWLVVRAAGGVVVSLMSGKFARAAIHFQAMIGRVEGLASRSPRLSVGETETRASSSRATRSRRRSDQPVPDTPVDRGDESRFVADPSEKRMSHR